MKIPGNEYVPALPGLLLAGLSAVLFSAARWLQTFDDDRPDLGGDDADSLHARVRVPLGGR